jgi:vacuolar-type H+-ATPase subunit H
VFPLIEPGRKTPELFFGETAMDIRLQELLERIKKEGTDEAKADAQALRAEAESERKAVLAQAEGEAKALVDKAKTEAERFEASAVSALGQASRDLVLSFKDEIQKLFAAVIRRETEAAFDETVLKNALPAILAGWKDKGTDDLTVLLPPAELKKLESFFADKLNFAEGWNSSLSRRSKPVSGSPKRTARLITIFRPKRSPRS